MHVDLATWLFKVAKTTTLAVAQHVTVRHLFNFAKREFQMSETTQHIPLFISCVSWAPHFVELKLAYFVQKTVKGNLTF